MCVYVVKDAWLKEIRMEMLNSTRLKVSMVISIGKVNLLISGSLL